MTSPVPGWYPDPHTDSMIRYWDGEAWTSHTAPASGDSPTTTEMAQVPPSQAPAGEASAGMDSAGEPQAAESHSAESHSAESHSAESPSAEAPTSESPTSVVPRAMATPPQPVDRGAQSPLEHSPSSGSRSVWDTPAADSGDAAASSWRTGTAAVTTDDGEMLASPSRRIAAFTVDSFIVTLPVMMVMPVLAPQWWATVQNTWDTVNTTHAHPQAVQFVYATSLLVGVVHYLYDWVLTTLTGSTPGRRLFGLWVRMASEPMVPGWTVSGQRSLLKLLHSITSPIAVVQFFTKVWLLVDATRMVSHARHEAWHDRLTSTVVVRRP